MKKAITLLSILVLIVSLQGSAQTANKPDSTNPHNKVKKEKTKKNDLSGELGLSKDQSQKLEEYKKDAKQKKTTVNNDTTLTKSQKSQQLKAIKDGQNKNISTILTKDQQTKMKQLKTEHKKNKTSNYSSPQTVDSTQK